MFLEAYITVRLEVTEDELYQKAVARALLEHVELLRRGDVPARGTEGAVTWDVVLSE